MRILIDCTGINIRKRVPTGIPRVVQNYLRFGYEYGAQRGITVLPVFMHHGELFLLPSSADFPHPDNLPDDLMRRRLMPRLARIAQAFALLAGYALYALPWLGFQLLSMASGKDQAKLLVKRRNAFGQILLEPADALGRLALRDRKITVRKGDILFSPAYWHDVAPRDYKRLRGQASHTAVLIHDVIPVSHPQYYRAGWREEFAHNVSEALLNFDSVITISHYTADMLRRLYPREAGAVRIAVCHNGLEHLADGVGSDTAPLALRGLALPPFLMVGTIEPKKGHLLVLRVLEQLWDEGRVQRNLVILGRKGWMYDEIVAALKSSRHATRIIWISDADDAALAFAYRQAHLLIHASEVEGFGLPMIESADLGTPVVARRSEIASEVLGEFGIYFDGERPESLRDVLLDLESGPRHQEIRGALRRFKWPEWQAVAPALFARLKDQAEGRRDLPEAIIPE